MVFIMNREGTIVETVTSPVHQGSNANEILLLAPFAPTNTVTVGFKLPNGILIQPRLTESGTGETMTPLEVNDLFLKVGADEESMSAWYIKINRDLTRYSGELGIQFFIYDGAGDILASSYATVTVQKGVPILDGTTFDTGTATQLQAALDKVYAALTAVQSNKVDKINTPHALYATDENGEDTFIGFSYDGKPSAGEIPMYMRNGTLPVGMPEADGDATTKSYVDDAKSEAFSFAFETASQIDLSYNEEKEELTMTRTVENKVIPLTGVIALKDRVDFLSTLLFNTIITLTEVEDTYTSRVTAGGLPVVSNTPTTVHKITGASAASINLATVKDQTIISNGVTFTGSATDGTVQMTGSVTEENEYATATVTSGFYLPVGTYTLYAPHKAGKVGWHVRNAQGTSIAELNWNGTTTAVSFTVSAAGNYYLYVFIPRSAGTLDCTETPMLLSSDRTASLPAFEPYYAGVKHAAFRGIGSSGRNLLHHIRTDSVTLNGITMTTEPEEGTVSFSGTVAGGDFYVRVTQTPFYLPRGQYTFYLPRRVQGLSWYLVNSSGVTVAGLSWTNATKSVAVTIDREGSYYIDVLSPDGKGVHLDYTETPMILCGTVTENFPAFETYRTDTSFALATPVTLGKWDYIDIDNQRVVTGTANVTQETAFTDEELATYPAGYILSADRKTIAYPLETPTTAPLTVPKTYTAWRGGLETVDTGATDALPPTITQTYYEEVTA